MTSGRDLLLMALLVAGTHDAGHSAVSASDLDAAGIRTSTVAQTVVSDTVHAFGNVVADGEPPEIRDARAESATAEARLALARQQTRRLAALASGKLAPRKEQETARAEEIAATAAAERARQVFAAFGSTPERRPLGTDETWVVAQVMEHEIARVRIGARIRFAPAAETGRFPGRVDAAPAYVDPVTHMAPVRLRVRDPRHTLRPGMTGAVRVFVEAPRRVATVPAAAVVYDGGHPLVFVAERSGRFAAQPVALGVTGHARVEIDAGVPVGATIVTTGAASLLSARRLRDETPDE